MADNINYLLGAPTYTNEKQQRVATGEGAYGQMEDYMQQYLNRGDWRMAMDQGASSPYGPLQHRDASGAWSDWTNPIVGYDPRQDSNTLDSNERRRFNQGFLQGNTGTDLRGDNLQTVAVQNGWKEPSRNDKTTLMSMVGDIAPYVGLFAGGVGALNGLAGMLGATGNTASLMSGLGDVTADIAAGTGELGSSTANLMSGLGDTVADLGGHSMSDLMSGLGDTVADLPGMDALDPRVIDLFDKAGTPGYNNYGEPLTWYEQLLQGLNGGKSLFQLGSTASGLLGLGTKLLSGLDLVRRQRDALNTNDQRLRDSKDTTPLSATSFNMLRPTTLRRAKGGLAQCAECGAGSSTPRYVQGGTSGQSDKIPALLSDGEYVFDADSVAALGDGNNAAGAAALDQMRQNIRKHKRSAPTTKIPPKAKRPEHYLKGAK